jgi:hypothetical protein
MDNDNSETGIIFHIDYLGITVFRSFDEFKPIWDKYYSSAFGDLVDTQQRTAFFKQKFSALAGVVLLAEPTERSKRVITSP